jgi:CubicO group peptidase (beta-lactamase class C family)
VSLKKFAFENIFKPLGMHDTQFSETYEGVNNEDKAWGYHKWSKRKYKLVPSSKQYYPLMGPTGLYSTLDDLILWQKNFDHNILGSNGQRIVEKMYTVGKLNNGGYNNAGYGLFINWYLGKVMIGHDGGAEGFSTDIQKLSKERLAVICLSNTTQGAPSHFIHTIFSIFFPSPKSFNVVNFSEVPPTTTSYLMQYKRGNEGVYYDGIRKKIKIISVKNDTLLSYDYPCDWAH